MGRPISGHPTLCCGASILPATTAATASTAVTTAATTTAAATAAGFIFSSVDFDGTTIKFFAVHCRNSFLCAFAIAKCYKAETTGTTRFTILDNLSFINVTVGFEGMTQRVVIGIPA